MLGNNNRNKMLKKLLLCLLMLSVTTRMIPSLVVDAALERKKSGSRSESRANMRRLLSSKQPEEMVQVIVGFSNVEKQIEFETRMGINLRSSASSVSKVSKFHHTHAVSIELSALELDELLTQTSEIPDFDYIEPDNVVKQFSTQELPYGIATVLQAGSSSDVFNNIPLPRETQNANDCFRVCVVDSGLIEGHTDMEFDRSMPDYRFNGKEFDLPRDQFWYNPDPFTSNHGTHVTGTIFASGNNGQGVIGVVPSAQGMCLSIARVFEDGIGSTTSTSAVNDAVEWCADQGSKIINLSLGSNSENFSSQDIYTKLYEDDGILIVAAAGNDGLGDAAFSYQYPASYDYVMSVAAVDENMDRAVFSQQNDEVDIAAPGVQVLSTAGGTVELVDSANNNQVYIGGISDRVMDYSRSIDPDDGNDAADFFSGDLELVDCGLGEDDACSGAQDKVCLIERGELFFWEKAESCQNGEGIMALIYNNDDGLFFGTLTPEQEDSIDIPVFSLTREEGLDLRNNVVGRGNKINLIANQFGYSYLSGTSMASPHIAGVAARIWAARPQCTNVQIEEAILQTALDLGPSGKDDAYGAGLVQGVDAYTYLLTEFPEPCGEPFELATGCASLRQTCNTDDDCCLGLSCSSYQIDGPKFCRGGTLSAGKDQYASRFGGRGGAARRSGGIIPGESNRLLGGLRGTTTATGNEVGGSGSDIPEIDGAAGTVGNKKRRHTVSVDFQRGDK